MIKIFLMLVAIVMAIVCTEFIRRLDEKLDRDEVSSSYDQRAGVLCIRSTVGLSHSISCVRYVPGTAL